MRGIDNSSSAFSRTEEVNTVEGGNQTHFGEPGMTMRQYAAIKLQVSDSGVDWLDAMIVKANREKMAGMALQGAIANLRIVSVISRLEGELQDNMAKYAYENADAMLKAREVKS